LSDGKRNAHIRGLAELADREFADTMNSSGAPYLPRSCGKYPRGTSCCVWCGGRRWKRTSRRSPRSHSMAGLRRGSRPTGSGTPKTEVLTNNHRAWSSHGPHRWRDSAGAASWRTQVFKEGTSVFGTRRETKFLVGNF